MEFSGNNSKGRSDPGTFARTPCETWTAARHHQQIDDEGNAVRGPRPLRSASDPWGLLLLTFGELAQIYTGNILLLKGLFLACLVALQGGVTILEHPATPYDDSISSIWRLGLVRLLQRPPHGPFRRVSAAQWKFGSCGIKPTTFLYSNSDLPASLDVCQDPNAQKPDSYLIGKNPDGSYRTAKAKEYPSFLNKAFAHAIFVSIQKRTLSQGITNDEAYGRQLADMAIHTEYDAIKPDYQPR